MQNSITNERDQFLALDDDQALKLCRVDRFRGSGRGGQKRNVTDSAVRVTHVATGYVGSSDATRSQMTNRKLAVRRLRDEMALRWRMAPAPEWHGNWAPSQKNRDYARWVAVVLDVIAEEAYRLGPAARRLGVGTGRLGRDLGGNGQLWQHVNTERQRLGLSILRKN